MAQTQKVGPVGIIAVAILSTIFAIAMDQFGITGWIMKGLENVSRG